MYIDIKKYLNYIYSVTYVAYSVKFILILFELANPHSKVLNFFCVFNYIFLYLSFSHILNGIHSHVIVCIV